MIQLNQPKKTKGARKKARQEAIERLRLLHPVWFEGKTDKEIRDLVNTFRLSKKDDEEFPNFCIKYEAEMERMKDIIANTSRSMMSEYDKLLGKAFPEIANNMRDTTPEEKQSIKDHIDEISEPTDVNFNHFFDGVDFLEYCENKFNEKNQKKF